MSAVMAPSAMVGSVTDGSLKALTLTGNREMAEDLERVACSTCSRLFAPSVLSRHAPICAARAAKNAPPPPPSAAPPTPAWSNSSEIAAPSCLQLTPTAGRVLLQGLRPSVSAAIDLARARGRVPSGTDEPSRMPGEPPIFVGSGAHAANLGMFDRLGVRAVLNLAPSVCRDPVDDYKARGIAYLQLSAHDDQHFPLLDTFLKPASEFISSAHAVGGAVLVHCMAGVNRSATIVVAYLMMRDRRNLLELFAECSAARPSILQNPSFQLQLCALAQRNGLLWDPRT
jgi:hypothetical protein